MKLEIENAGVWHLNAIIWHLKCRHLVFMNLTPGVKLSPDKREQEKEEKNCVSI